MQKPIPNTNDAYDRNAGSADLPRVETCPICSTDAILDYCKLEPLLDIASKLGRAGQIMRDKYLVEAARRNMEQMHGFLAESLSNVPVRLDGPHGAWTTLEDVASEDLALARKVASQLLVAEGPVVKLQYSPCPNHGPGDPHVAYFHSKPGEEFAGRIMN